MRIYRNKSLIRLTLALLVSTMAAADDNAPGTIEQLKGIAIVGDREAPKSLYIVPWHRAEHQQSTRLSTQLIDNNMRALDRDSLLWQLQLYELSQSDWYRFSADTP